MHSTLVCPSPWILCAPLSPAFVKKSAVLGFACRSLEQLGRSPYCSRVTAWYLDAVIRLVFVKIVTSSSISPYLVFAVTPCARKCVNIEGQADGLLLAVPYLHPIHLPQSRLWSRRSQKQSCSFTFRATRAKMVFAPLKIETVLAAASLTRSIHRPSFIPGNTE